MSSSGRDALRWVWFAAGLLLGAVAATVVILIVQSDAAADALRAAREREAQIAAKREFVERLEREDKEKSARERRERIDAARSRQSANASPEERLDAYRAELVELGSEDAPSDRARANELLKEIDRLVIARTVVETNSIVAMASTTLHQGLAKYAAAEDSVRAAFESGRKVGNKADEALFAERYQTLLHGSDDYAARVLTPEFIESVPWKDLLDGEHSMRWSKVKNVPGFTFRLESGVLTLTAPDAGSGQTGVAGILDQMTDNVRHFVLDMEFTVEGVATMFFHVSPPPYPPNNLQSETYELNATAGGALRPQHRYEMLASYIGSRLVVTFPHEKSLPAYEPTPSWTKRRRGGIAFVVPEGCRLTITRMRIKELR